MSVQQVQLELDSNVRRVSNGTALLGGSPFRVVRLSAAGSRLLDRWIEGDAKPLSDEALRLRNRLIRAGLVHPVAAKIEALPTVAFVVPVYDDAVGLESLLSALRCNHPDDQIIVVDDASPDNELIARVSDRHNAQLISHDRNRGPGAARNTGWRSIARSQSESADAVDVVVFVDADVTPRPDATATLLVHFVDSDVAVVAPRVQAASGGDILSSYETHNSPLDMGTERAIVYPGTRLSYVPSAMLAVRTTVLEHARGFDEAMRYGEDVDMVWRLIHDGQFVRYEPAAVADHRNRVSLTAFARQRFTYGSSAASLASRHGEKVAPLQLPVAPVLSTIAMLFGTKTARLGGVVGALAGAVPLARKLKGKVDESNAEALRLTAMTHGYAAQGLATAATRSWAPLLLLVPRARRTLALALVVPSLIDWVRQRPALDPVCHTALRAVDHGAYCAGVWSGVVQTRSVAALLPHLRLRHEAR